MLVKQSFTAATMRGFVITKATHQKKKLTTIAGRPRIFDTKELTDAVGFWDGMFMMAPARPDEPIKGPVIVLFSVYMDAPKGRAKRLNGDPNARIPMAVKPDIENLAKTVIDRAVAAGWILNDAQVFMAKIEKFECLPGNSQAFFSVHEVDPEFTMRPPAHMKEQLRLPLDFTQ